MDSAAARSMNATMIERLLDAPAEPIPDGGYALRVVRTRGRRSGERRATPLGVLRHDGALHLVSPVAGRDWVRNLVADPQCEVAGGGESTPYRAALLTAADAVATIAAYLHAVDTPWALSAFPVAADAGPQEITAHLDEMAAFRLDPR